MTVSTAECFKGIQDNFKAQTPANIFSLGATSSPVKLVGGQTLPLCQCLFKLTGKSLDPGSIATPPGERSCLQHYYIVVTLATMSYLLPAANEPFADRGFVVAHYLCLPFPALY